MLSAAFIASSIVLARLILSPMVASIFSALSVRTVSIVMLNCLIKLTLRFVTLIGWVWFLAALI